MFISDLFGSNNNSLNAKRSCGSALMGCAVVLSGTAISLMFFMYSFFFYITSFVHVCFSILGENKGAKAALYSAPLSPLCNLQAGQGMLVRLYV